MVSGTGLGLGLGLGLVSGEEDTRVGNEEQLPASKRRCSGEEKENMTGSSHGHGQNDSDVRGEDQKAMERPSIPVKAASAPSMQGLKSRVQGVKGGASAGAGTKRIVSLGGSSGSIGGVGSGSVKAKAKPRIGLRRL